MYKTPLQLFPRALSFIDLLNILTTMRAFLLLLVSFFGLTTSQAPHYEESPRSAAILSDTRYLSGDGTFGASYKQEDGVEFKEESDEFGNRKGSYSYIDPTGQRRTVTYTAGKDGFQVLPWRKATGDHIPTAAPQIPPEPVQPEYVPLPQYNSPDYEFPKGRFYDSRFETQNRYETVTESSRRPESRIQFQYEYQHNPVRYQPSTPEYEPQIQPRKYEPPPQHQPRKYEPPPQYQARKYEPPQYQPPQYQPPQYQPHHYEPPQYQKPVYSPPYRPPPPVSEYRPLSRPPPQYNEITTPTPRRFYPPGKLDFNRTPDGFSYTFSKT